MRRPLAVLVLAALCALPALAGCDDGRSSAGVGSPTSSAPSTPPSAPSPDSAYPTYVALGDSYTAAPGVPQTETETGCLRSDSNYPHLLAQRLGSTLVDASCSGASTTSLVGAQDTGGQVQPPQFAALSTDTSLVTLGIGGNDFGLFETIGNTCGRLAPSDPAGSPCRDHMAAGGAGQDLLTEKIRRIRGLVTAALEGVHDRAPAARVLLVGYPQLVPASGTCDILPLAAGDYAYVRGLLVELDDALRAAAAKAGAEYVDLLGPSRGHDICAGADAWINGDHTDLGRALAFHPFASEQQAVADLIARQLQQG